MSLWNLLCEAALFNMVCKWFSGKPKARTTVSQPHHNYIPAPEYEARIGELDQEIRESQKRIDEYRNIVDSSQTADMEDYDISDLQDCIDELEDRLCDCDVLSDRYDRIQDEIDSLQERLYDMEENHDAYHDMYDDFQDDPYDRYDDDFDDIAYDDPGEDW